MNVEAPVEFPEIWTTRDGRKLRVSDMDEHHVRAALAMVIRRARKREALLKIKHDIERILRLTPSQRELMDKHDIGLDEMFGCEDRNGGPR